MTYIDRRAARVLLIDAAGRALLLHGGDPAQPGRLWWLTPGGGLHDGETPAQGAARELFEETGLRVDPAELGEPVHSEVTEFSFNARLYRQEQDFFAYRPPEWTIDDTGLDADERHSIIGHRWWTIAEIEAADEEIYPAGLAELLRRCAAQGVPSGGF
ncbi:NUDIX domain-containing protein [Couchioplanes caeruleus]|uniref:NUDIX hydrolase n=1 Tax=Couchioplanes caeruleus TaxID=56438 RepID=UPI00201BE44F|nr:NUDIX domain-containing protein [Couchioplanes caeruleus]UQU66246.1 NUDIX domain-containing protein [Couchioplanes caeruleus]